MADRIITTVAAWTGWPVVLVVCFLGFLWPGAEARWLPVRTDQSVGDVFRGPVVVGARVRGDALCWTWTSVKRRPRVSDGIDAVLLANGRRFDVSPYSPVTGDPWNAGQALPVDPAMRPQAQRYCVDVPPSVPDDAVLRLAQVVLYPSLLPLQHVALRVPDVTSP